MSDQGEKPTVRFYTQHRQHISPPAGQMPYDSGWHFVCDGHDTQYEAIGCHDHTKKQIGMAMQSLVIHKPIPNGQIGTVEVRIVKITTVIEIVEEPTTVEAGES